MPLLHLVSGAGTPSPRITYYAAPQKHRVRCLAGTWSQGGSPPRQWLSESTRFDRRRPAAPPSGATSPCASPTSTTSSRR